MILLVNQVQLYQQISLLLCVCVCVWEPERTLQLCHIGLHMQDISANDCRIPAAVSTQRVLDFENGTGMQINLT